MPFNLVRQCLRLSLLAPLVLMVVACSETDSHLVIDQETGQASLNVPGDLPLFRAVDQDQVSVRTSIDGQIVSMDRDGNRWSATIAVNQGAEYPVTIRWVEQVNDIELPLGIAKEFVAVVDTAPVRLEITQSNIDISFDLDDDDSYNLLERENGTDPTPPSGNADPAIRPALQNINVFFGVPDAVSAIDQINENALFPVIEVNAEPAVPLSGNTQVAPVVIVDNPDIPVFIDITWFLTDGQLVRLARVAKRYTMAVGQRDITVPQEDFKTNYDQDADGVFNLDELAAGTNPLAP